MQPECNSGITVMAAPVTLVLDLKSAPLFRSSSITSVLPSRAARESGEAPFCTQTIAITYRNREINVYYDSSLILSQSINNPIKNTIRDSNFIGKSMNSDNVQDGRLDEFDGNFDEFKIFDRVLSIDEINYEMNKKQPYIVL